MVGQRSSHTRHAKGTWRLSTSQMMTGYILSKQTERLPARKLLLRSWAMDVEIIRRAAGGDILCALSVEQTQWNKRKVIDTVLNEMEIDEKR